MTRPAKKNSDERLVRLALELDERLNESSDVLNHIPQDSDQLSPAELEELQRAGEVLAYLHRAHRDLGILASDTPREANSTQASGDRVSPEGPHASHGQQHPLDDADPSMLKKLGRYEITGVLGQGGFSRVFLARDPDLDRLVALKVPLPHTLANEASRRRFEREARAVAVLSHPAITPIYEAGSIGPVSYIAFGYCPGQDLRQWFSSRQHNIPASTAAEIVAKLAEVAEHAHQRGIVHRDLKPSNILLEMNEDDTAKQGKSQEATTREVMIAEEERSDSRPALRSAPLSHAGTSSALPRRIADRIRVTDFGLAQLATATDESLTIEGSVVGTPAYMSPEQASGCGEITASSDIYSLGVILFELLSGQVPFKGKSHLSTLRAIESTEPLPPTRIRADVPRDLEAICLKCLRKSPHERYASAHELATDLQRWLQGVPVVARPASTFEKLVAWGRRNPRLAVMTALSACSVLAGLASTTWQWRNAVAQTRLANQATAAAVQAKEEAIQANQDNYAFSEFLVHRVLAAARPVGQQGGLGKDVTLMKVLESIEPKIAEDFADRPHVEAKIRNAFGATWRSMGELDRAALEFQAVARLTDFIGPLDVQTLQSSLEAANVLAAEGRYAQATELLRQTHDLAAASLGEQHMITFGCSSNLAAIALEQGNFEEAIPLLESTCDTAAEKYGEHHSVTHQVRVNLAVAYRRSGQPRAAINILASMLAVQQESLGESDYQTLRTMSELADAYTQINEPALGLPLFERARPISERLLGRDHPKTIELIQFSATNQRALGNMEAAFELHNEAITIAKKKYGEYHAETNECILALANTYRSQGDFENFEAVITGLIQSHRDHDNEDAALRLIERKVQAKMGLGEFESAEQLALEYIPKLVHHWGVKNVFTQELTVCLADLYSNMGQWSKADSVYRKLMEALSDEPPRTDQGKMAAIVWLSRRAECLIHLERFKEAVVVARESCDVYQPQLEGIWARAQARSVLGAAQFEVGQIAEAETNLVQAHDALIKHFDINPMRDSLVALENSCDRLAEFHQRSGQSAQSAAVRQLREELQTRSLFD